MDSYGVFEWNGSYVSSWGLALWLFVMFMLIVITSRARSKVVGLTVFLVFSGLITWVWSLSSLWFIAR